MKNGFVNIALALACAVSVPTFASELVLKLGTVSSKPAKRIKSATPLMHHLVNQLKQDGYTSHRINVYQTIEELNSAILNKEVDLLSSTLYSALLYEKHANTSMIAKRWKKGNESYRSIFVAKSDSDVNSLSDLQGKVIGFESRESTSSYFLPKLTLLENGYNVKQMSAINEQPDADTIGYVFFDDLMANSNEINLSMWASRGAIDAIAYSTSNWENKKDTPTPIKNRLKSFYETDAYPRSLMSAGSHVPTPIVKKIQKALYELDSTEEGRAILTRYQTTKKFTPIDDASQEHIDKARRQLQYFEAHE